MATQMVKRLSPFFLMAALLLCLCPAPAHADLSVQGVSVQTDKSSGLLYTLNDGGGVVVCGVANKNAKQVKIPVTISVAGVPTKVVAIAPEAFKGNTKITSVTYDKSGGYELATIGASAFEGCTKLAKVELPDSVTTIDDRCFASCALLESAACTSASKLQRVGSEAFSGCSVLGGFYFPGQVEQLGSGVFEGCKGIYTVTLPTKLTEIPDRAFCDCEKLNKLKNVGNITVIGDKAFYATGFMTFPFTVGLETIGEGAFGECEKLEIVNLPNSVVSVGKGAFQSCTALKSFTLPTNSGFQTICEDTFRKCEKLVSIVVPENVTTVEKYAFSYIPGLKSVYFNNKDTDLKVTTAVHPFSESGSNGITIYGISGGKVEDNVKRFEGWRSDIIFKAFGESALATLTYAGYNSKTADGGQHRVGQQFALPDCPADLKDPGKTFIGWMTTPTLSSGGSVEDYVMPADSLFTLAGDTTLYAYFGKKAEDGTTLVTLTLENTRNTFATKTVMLKPGETYTLPSCGSSGASADGKTGYAFSGWLCSYDEKTYKTGETFTVPDTDVTFTTKFSITYKVVFKTNQDGKGGKFLLSDGQLVEEVDLYTQADGKIKKFPVALKDGSTVKAWINSNNGNPVVAGETDFGDLTRKNGGNTITVFTTWEPKDNPVITFDASPGTIDGEEQKQVTTNSSFMIGGQGNVPVPTAPEGYAFGGWGSKTASGIQRASDLVSRIFTEDETFHAIWITTFVDSVTLSKTSATLTEGETLQLSATVKPADATDSTVTWKSSDTKVATVSAKGLVKAVGSGKATITASANDGGEASATCAVTVKAKAKAKTKKNASVKVKKATVTLKAAKLKKKAQTFGNLVVKCDKGKATYKNVSKDNKAKKFKVDKKTGKVTVPKGTKKATYKMKVKVVVKAGTAYKKLTKTVSFKVKVG